MARLQRFATLLFREEIFSDNNSSKPSPSLIFFSRIRWKHQRPKTRFAVVAFLILEAVGSFAVGAGEIIPQFAVFPDPSGSLATLNQAGLTVKGPILRGLAGRAPYFHNASAATLRDAVNFYNTRFTLNLSQQDEDDLVAFLNTL